MNLINLVQPLSGSWLVDIILWLEKITASIVLSVVLFTVILKLITFPFDFISRATMRKNSLKMEQMRPELEKLQKQYANDKGLYNQKMMALYKKNGYSMWGSCLPTILTLVIFIVAINAFTNFSRFKNKEVFYDMSLSYNAVVYDGLGEADGYIEKKADGTYEIDYQKIFDLYKNNEFNETKDGVLTVKKNPDLTVANGNSFVFYTESGYLMGIGYYEDSKGLAYQTPFEVKDDFSDNQMLKSLYFKNSRDGEKIDFNKFVADKKVEIATKADVKEFIQNVQQYASAETFREKQARFLWVKNIWVTDSPLKQPVNGDYKTFINENSGADFIKNDTDYKELIKKLEPEATTEPNGFFIMVILTAGVSLLSQLVTAKSQKAQMELQTVDGQGAQTQKMMMWIMPIMMAVFAFMYTTAFSIYIVLSSLLSMGSTFIINFFVDRKFKRVESTEKQIIRGRVYVPEEKPKEEPKPKKKKKEETPTNDFLSGLADKKGGKKRK